uniref:non-specific serine/threonine protein kinase n=1 Tax=Kryptolebias marmoratus TaxID=37003 RepID=A0A3Q2ZA28_KRYMA
MLLESDVSCLLPVGSGGFGSVYRAEYLGQTVALKRVKKSAKNQLASRQSFWAELNAAHLQHRNVVRVIAATTCVPADFEDEGSIGVVLMEFVGGGNLQQVIYDSPEPLEESRWFRYSADIAAGLRFLHSHGLVHLDIKPANVLLSSAGVCKIADFGCSIKLDRDCEVSSMGPHVSHVCGTYTHRAPELAKQRSRACPSTPWSYCHCCRRAPPRTWNAAARTVVRRDLTWMPCASSRPPWSSRMRR